mmetsp:Transcript_7517/g.9098  ORF Transcript_7517/g.9098 Transcript_7517/m.9098 type:complete len:425 (+) Transcript_7517:2-1276(+)
MLVQYSLAWCNDWKSLASIDDENENEKKLEETRKALANTENITVFNDLQHPFGISRHRHAHLAIVNYQTPKHKEDSWFGSIFGVPLLIQRLNGKKLQPIIPWLKKKILRWRKYQVHPEWTDHETAVQPRAKYHKHNVLVEALSSDKSQVKHAATYLLEELRKRFLLLMALHEELPVLKDQECPGNNLDIVWRNRTKEVPFQVLLPIPPGVSQQSYVLSHRYGYGKRYDHLKFHHHQFAWHATLILDGEGTNTTYHAPSPIPNTPRPLFNIVNGNFMLIMSAGGYEHAVPPPPPTYKSHPRLSVAFDFLFDLAHPKEGAVRHPSARFPSEPFMGGKDPLHLDPHSFFAPFITPDDLKLNLEKRGRRPRSFDWTSLIPNGPEPPAGKQYFSSFWAGTIDLRPIVPPPEFYSKLKKMAPSDRSKIDL